MLRTEAVTTSLSQIEYDQNARDLVFAFIDLKIPLWHRIVPALNDTLPTTDYSAPSMEYPKLTEQMANGDIPTACPAVWGVRNAMRNHHVASDLVETTC